MDLLERVMGISNDPHARLAEDILDDINRVRAEHDELPLDRLPAWAYCPNCRTLRVIK